METAQLQGTIGAEPLGIDSGARTRSPFVHAKRPAEADLLVRAKGLEPIRLTAPDPKSGLATNYNTPATL